MQEALKKHKGGGLNQAPPKPFLNLECSEEGWSASQVYSHLQNYPCYYLVANNDLKAYILYVEVGDVIEICYLETLPPFRRQGLMTRLLQGLIFNHPGKKLWLGVHGENQKAVELYDKLGFKNSGLRKGYYRDGGDCLLLERVGKAD